MRAKVFVGLIAVCLIWGTSWMVVKVSIETVPPLLSAALRFAVATVFLAFLLRFRRGAFPAARTFWGLGIMLGVVAFTIPLALTYWGQKQIPSGLASVLFATFPFWVAGLSHLLLPNERMTVWKGLGTVLGFLGIVVIFAADLSLQDFLTVWGMVAIIASALTQALSMVLMRKHGGPYDTIPLVTVGMAIGAVCLGLISPLVEDYSVVHMSWGTFLANVYLGIFASVVAFGVYFWLLKYIEAVFLSLTAFVTPIIAVATGALVLNEGVSTNLALGSALVLMGILASNGKDLADVVRKGRVFSG